MYIENKSGESDLSGDARIGRVTFSKSGKSIQYKGRTFETLRGLDLKQTILTLSLVTIIGFQVVRRMVVIDFTKDCQFSSTMMRENSIGLKFDSSRRIST